MKILSTIFAGLCLVVVLNATPQGCQANDVSVRKPDVRSSLDSQDPSGTLSPLTRERTVLDKPRAGLLWADWSDQYGLGLLSKLSATLAGFVFIAIVAVLQASVRRETKESTSASTDSAFGATLSALLASFLILIIAADLFARCCGDAIEIRQQSVEALANFVLATGLVLMMFGINWALALYQPHASVKWTACYMFWGMLIYTWTVLIPTSGWTVEAIVSYLGLDAAAATTSQYHWHGDMVFFAGSFLLLAGLPLFGAFAVRSRRITNKSILVYEKRYWVICTVVGSILATIWCQFVLDGVRYTGNPHHPIILGELTRFFLYHHPRLFFGVLCGLFGLFSAVCVLSLPPNETPEKQGDPEPQQSRNEIGQK